MSSLQYLIDTICSKLTAEAVYSVIESRLSGGAFQIDEVIPAIQSADRSLDRDSARTLAEAAVQDLAKRGILSVEDGCVRPLR